MARKSVPTFVPTLNQKLYESVAIRGRKIPAQAFDYSTTEAYV